jgi:hypothetical protein
LLLPSIVANAFITVGCLSVRNGVIIEFGNRMARKRRHNCCGQQGNASMLESLRGLNGFDAILIVAVIFIAVTLISHRFK